MDEITGLEKQDIPEFSQFIRTVYDEFVALDYSPEGNRTFYDYIDGKEIEERLAKGGLFYVYRTGARIVGGIEIRNLNHISLFFVDGRFHNRGIGKQLLAFATEKILSAGGEFLEVNSSPYAKEIYKKLGFVQKSGLLEEKGIKYYKLELSL